MFQSTPTGSPLDPRRMPVGVLAGSPDPLAPLPAPQAPQMPQGALAAPQEAPTGAMAHEAMQPSIKPMAQSLPKAPTKPKINPFDRAHIARYLADIGKGFAGATSFGDGLAKSFGSIADGLIDETTPKKPTVELGGPDNAFEIVTNPDGTREYKPIAAYGDYLSKREKAKNAPKLSDSQSWIGDTAYAIEQLPEEKRAGAWQLVLQQGHEAGYDLTGVPDEYSPTFNQVAIARTIGARQGATNAATLDWRNRVDADRDATRAIAERRAGATIANGQATQRRAEEKHQRAMRSPPPSTRRSSNSDLDYLR